MRAASRALLLAAMLACVVAPASHAQSPGAPGVGDSYYPLAGNGGFQVDDYDLAIRFAPGRGTIRARAAITATASQALSSFNLDLRGLRVESVAVNGAPASFSRRGAELTVVPATALEPGPFTVDVSYRGRPKPIPGPAHTPTGWNPTPDGSFVASEPRGAHGWFPCNDHPSDKATYTIAITVPKGRTAVSNGILVEVRRSPGSRTFVWREDAPMATYLATATTGRFRLKRTSVNGLPSWIALDPALARKSRRGVALLPRLTSHMSALLGDYPFSSNGVIADSGFEGLVLETQTRPLFGQRVSTGVLAHEIAHQWLGNSVTPEDWSDIWLNEGFATWAEWHWYARGRDSGLRRIFKRWYSVPARVRRLWSIPVADPGESKMFSAAVYLRGGMTLEALRQTIGGAPFRDLLRRWVAEHRHGNATTAEFQALAEAVSGRDLDRFFSIWLRQKSKPRNWG